MLNFDVHEVTVIGGEQVVFNLVHTNQIATRDPNELRLSLKAENMAAADRYLKISLFFKFSFIFSGEIF